MAVLQTSKAPIRLGKTYGLLSGIGNESDFASSWNTANTSAGSSTSTQVKLPLTSAGTYNFTVKWGDGNQDAITAFDQAEVTHTYASSGTYTITIDGICDGWRFNNTGDRLKILDISQWGNVTLGNENGYFYGAANFNITATDTPDLSLTTDMTSAFQDATVFNGNIGSWDVFNVTTMGAMFMDAATFNQNIVAWKVNNVTSMLNMFRSTSFNQNLIFWNTGSVTNMAGMFRDAFSFDQDIGTWNITSVTSMSTMFQGVLLSTPNYNGILVEWEKQSVQNNVFFDGGDSKFSSGAPATARTNLINDHTWTIADGGPA